MFNSYHQNSLINGPVRGMATAFAVLLAAILVSFPAAAEIELFGGNPLFEAIKANNLEQAEAAINGGEDIEVQDFDGRRAVIYAALVGSLDILELLIRRSANVNHRDKLGNAALYYAASQGDADISEALIDGGADKDTENRQGVTPLMVAAKLGYLDVVQLLIAKGANPNKRDYTGRTALMWADWNRKSAVARFLRKAGVKE